MTELAPAGDCRNCGSAAPGAYCPACGQETTLHPPSAAEFLHEFIGHYVALEGALWRSLKALAVPGRLTLEYFAGRRRQYVLPLRLYLTASIVFFLASRLVVPEPVTIVTPDGPLKAGAPFTLACSVSVPACVTLQERIRDRHPGQAHQQVINQIRQRLLHDAPYAMFFLVPIFAWLTRVAYWRRPQNYGEHLVFALHAHAFAFFVGALVAPLHYTGAMTIPAAIYVAVAMRQVFGGRELPLLLRFLFVLVAYTLLVIATISSIGMTVLFL